MGTLFLAAGIVLNAVANAFFKVGSGIHDLTLRKGLYVGGGLFLGFLGTLGYIKALEKFDLGTAFPTFSAATILLVALISFAVFHEAVTFQKGAGLVLLCIGMALLWR
jgi:multidrug transporter EmrE-like cation transporter